MAGEIERPIVPLGEPQRVRAPEARPRRGGGPKGPNKARQVERLTPQFELLQAMLDERRAILQADPTAAAPEQVLVFETNGPANELIGVIGKTAGFESLTEEDLNDLTPDDDFRYPDKPQKLISARLYMVMTSQAALEQLLSLWRRYTSKQRLPQALRDWAKVFAKLREIRKWGASDRLRETGLLEDWEERKLFGQDAVPVEIELWHRTEDQAAALARTKRLITDAGGQYLSSVVVPEIAYHGILASIPTPNVEKLLTDDTIKLVQADEIRLFRPIPQSDRPRAGEEALPQGPEPTTAERLEPPVVALLDGLPIENHAALANRLVVDDPDDWSATYETKRREHGTAMASLVLHGDLSRAEPPSPYQLYVRPILRPDRFGRERAPENELWVDLIHRAVKRIVAGEAGGPPNAPTVRVVNLSVGDHYRPFDSAISPLARLLDWLSWRYNLLFIVSAGNHQAPIEIDAPAGGTLSEDVVVKSLAASHRVRRLLSPAESINALTVGAMHGDDAGPVTLRYAEERVLFETPGMPSPFSALGRGFRRAVKPDLLAPGGRVVYTREIGGPTPPRYSIKSRPRESPGQKVAAPPGPRHTWFTVGTSNAAALTSREAQRLLSVIRGVLADGHSLRDVPEAVLGRVLFDVEKRSARFPAAQS